LRLQGGERPAAFETRSVLAPDLDRIVPLLLYAGSFGEF